MYSNYEHEVPMTNGVAVLDLTTTGDKARWSPMFAPTRIHAISLALNATPGDAGVVKFDKRPTFGSDTSRGDGDVAVLNLATTHTVTGGTQARVVYKMDLNILIQPGEEVVMEVTDASAAVTASKCSFWVEPVYETPANVVAGTGPLPSMVAST